MDREEGNILAPLRPIELVVIVVVAAALRLWRLSHGLPDFTEEAIPFKQALEMWGFAGGGTDFNPHFFNYPSLVIYLHFFLQKIIYGLGLAFGNYGSPADFWLLHQIDPTELVRSARLIGIGADLVTIAGVYVCGERLMRSAGGLAALIVAIAPTMITTSRLIYVDPVMTALAVWSLERMVAWQRQGGRRRIVWAIVLAGLAAGAKYNAGLLVLPLGWVLWRRLGVDGLKRWPIAAGFCLLVFLATSPFVVFDFGSFWRDFTFERSHMATGHFGTIGQSGAGFILATLSRNLGGAAVLLMLGAVATAVWCLRNDIDNPCLVLWVFLLPLVASLATFRMEAERYLLPVLPIVALVLSRVVLGWPRHLRRRPLRWGVTALLLTLLVVPPAWNGVAAARNGRTTTQQQARLWFEEHLGREGIIVQESWGAELRSVFIIDELTRHPGYAAAAERIQRRWITLPRHASIRLPMGASGNLRLELPDGSGGVHVVDLFEHASDFGGIFYEPALLAGVDYVLVSGAVSRRYEADPDRYAAQCRFYELLRTTSTLAAAFEPGGGIDGPPIEIYRLDATFQRALADSRRPLAPFWWAESISSEVRREIESRIIAPDRRADGAVLVDGQPAAWVLYLDPFFSRLIMPTLLHLAKFHENAGHAVAARRIAASIIEMKPEVTPAVQIFSHASAYLGDHEAAVAAIETSLRFCESQDDPAWALRLELARARLRAGAIAEGRATLSALLRDAPVQSRQAVAARRLLNEIPAD